MDVVHTQMAADGASDDVADPVAAAAGGPHWSPHTRVVLRPVFSIRSADATSSLVCDMLNVTMMETRSNTIANATHTHSNTTATTSDVELDAPRFSFKATSLVIVIHGSMWRFM